MPPARRTGDPLARAVSGLRFDRNIVGVGFDFEPSIGLVAKAIDKLGLDIQSFKEPLTRAVKTVVIPSIRQNFVSGGRPDAWAPLAPYTVKRRSGSERPILVRSGALVKAATSFDSWAIGSTSAIIRSLPSHVWYGNLHQAGYGGFKTHYNSAKRKLGKGALEADIQEAAMKSFLEAADKPTAKAISIPQRQFVMFQDEDVEAIQLVFYEWLGEQVEEAGFR